MPKRYIILQGIGKNKGGGVVSLCGDTITVSLSGTSEELSLFFMSSNLQGGDSKIDAGKIKGGFAKSFKLKESDVKKIDTVVLLKETEPIIYGSLAPLMPDFQSIKPDKTENKDRGISSPLGEDDGFFWLKIEDGRFPENLPIIRYVFENINVIAKINSIGYYFYGTKDYKGVVAIKKTGNEKNPFSHLLDCAREVNGYWTVGIDKKERYFYSLID